MTRLYHGSNVPVERIADDTVIRRYILGYMSASALVAELKFKGDNAVQYFFGTTRAIELLKHIER